MSEEKKKKTDETTKVSVARPSIPKSFSFEQWAKLRNVPLRHLKGMRAFLKEQAHFKHTLEKWDEIFKAY